MPKVDEVEVMILDIDEVQVVMLAVALSETIGMVLQHHDNGGELTPEIVEKLRTIHNLSQEFMGLGE